MKMKEPNRGFTRMTATREVTERRLRQEFLVVIPNENLETYALYLASGHYGYYEPVFQLQAYLKEHVVGRKLTSSTFLNCEQDFSLNCLQHEPINSVEAEQKQGIERNKDI